MPGLGIFVDTCDLYHKVQRTFGRGSKVCFDRYLDFINEKGCPVKIAYGMRSESGGFSSYLNGLGFVTKFKPPRVYNVGVKSIKKCDWNIMLAMDAIKAAADHNLDTVVIGSSNGLLLPLITYLREKGVNVIILASGIPDTLCNAVDSFIELDETYLEVENEFAK